jgi:hypothetical protein
MIGANISISGQIYVVRFDRGTVRVDGPEPRLARVAETLCRGALTQYSPSDGGLVANVVGYAARRMAAKVVQISEPQTEPGLVY